MRISLLDQLQLIRDVIENEHGGVVYDGEEYITPDWDSMDKALGAYRKTRDILNLEIMLENT
jgi:hypothetical protein